MPATMRMAALTIGVVTSAFESSDAVHERELDHGRRGAEEGPYRQVAQREEPCAEQLGRPPRALAMRA